MSLLPFIVDELLNKMDQPLHDQHFGLGIHPVERPLYHHPYHERAVSAAPLSVPLRAGYLRPWRHLPDHHSGMSAISNDKEGLKVNLDVQQFKPEELNVKVVDDHIFIEGKHEERSDEHGFISRHFTRRYKIPDNVDQHALTSSLSSDGVLQLHAPRKAIEGDKERSIPITQTNKPAIKHAHKDAKKNANAEEMEG